MMEPGACGSQGFAGFIGLLIGGLGVAVLFLAGAVCDKYREEERW
jgi:hypothetical protein